MRDTTIFKFIGLGIMTLVILFNYIERAEADDHDLSGQTYPVVEVDSNDGSVIQITIEVPSYENTNARIVDRNFKECKLIIGGQQKKVDPKHCEALGIL